MPEISQLSLKYPHIYLNYCPIELQIYLPIILSLSAIIKTENLLITLIVNCILAVNVTGNYLYAGSKSPCNLKRVVADRCTDYWHYTYNTRKQPVTCNKHADLLR